ncbi:MAG TPA: Gx transporter family protein [Deltaproteobacteria bacterium]|nr:Gx transporter family protein [Deltaproteobacteria bacterium]
MHKNSRITKIALLIAMAVALHWVESFIPRPAPFLRFGLANIITLTTLYTFGGPWALFVVISRVIIGSALAGGIFTPTFFFSLSGGIAAGIIMWQMPKGTFSAIGVSIGGAIGHMACQLFLAAIMIQHFSIMHILPFFLLASVITGMINGYCAQILLDIMQSRKQLSML